MKKSSFLIVSTSLKAESLNCELSIRNPKYVQYLNCQSNDNTEIEWKVRKFLARLKIIRYYNLSRVFPKQSKAFLWYTCTSKAPFLRNVSLPTPLNKKHIEILKQAKNLNEFRINKEYFPYRRVSHRNFTTFNFYLKKEKFIDDMYTHQVNKLSRFTRIQNIGMNCIWSKEGLGKIRKAMMIFSNYKDLKETFMKIEEDDISLFLHSYHNLIFWKKIKHLNLVYETADSLNGLLEYSGQLISLEYLVLNPGKKFHENAIKKRDYNLSGMGKFKDFPVLKTLDLSFNLKEITKQAIETVKSLSYSSSLLSLRLQLIIPDIDELIQKSNPSLTTITYLTVENQPPFKEFIANHSPLSNLNKFNLILKTKQLQNPQAKLIPALIKHMKVLTEFDLDVTLDSAKPFRYLALYNNFLAADRVKSIKMKFNTSTIDFVGSDLVELDNRMTGLRELSLYLPHEKIENEPFEAFFKAICIKPLEILKLHFLQVLDDKKLDKRFEYLKKCKNLNILLLRFMLPALSDLYPDEMLSFFENQVNVKEVTLELLSSKSDNYDMKWVNNALVNKRKLEYAYLKSNKGGMLKTKYSKQFKAFDDKDYIFTEYVKE